MSEERYRKLVDKAELMSLMNSMFTKPQGARRYEKTDDLGG